MLFLFLIHAEIQVVDTKLEKFKETEEEISCAITGKKEKGKIIKQLKLTPSPKCPSHYKGAQISIEQGGCPPSNDTTAADMRQIHEDIKKQPGRPMMVACRHSHDVFEQPHDKLRDPSLPQS